MPLNLNNLYRARDTARVFAEFHCFNKTTKFIPLNLPLYAGISEFSKILPFKNFLLYGRNRCIQRKFGQLLWFLWNIPGLQRIETPLGLGFSAKPYTIFTLVFSGPYSCEYNITPWLQTSYVYCFIETILTCTHTHARAHKKQSLQLLC